MSLRRRINHAEQTVGPQQEDTLAEARRELQGLTRAELLDLYHDHAERFERSPETAALRERLDGMTAQDLAGEYHAIPRSSTP
jgi:hypothetical protein